MAHPPEYQRPSKNPTRVPTKGVGGHKGKPEDQPVRAHKPLGHDPDMPTTFVPKPEPDKKADVVVKEAATRSAPPRHLS